MNTIKYTLLIVSVVCAFALTNCTKEISIPFPDSESQLVVDGSIELGQPALVFLVRTRSFNEPLDPTSLQDVFVQDALVRLSNGTDTLQLQEFCVADLTPELLEAAAEQFGISAEALAALGYCLYVDINGEMLGEVDTDYELMIETAEGKLLNSTTRINTPVPLDSLWFQIWADTDTLGFIYANLADPVDERNAYRWFAQRINSNPGSEEPKYFSFISPTGSTFEDRFFDGLDFTIFYNRGAPANSNADDDNNEEAGFFKLNDTVVVKLSATTLETFEYFLTSDDQATTNGSPFAVPTNLPSNIEGGLGHWAGYGPSIDTVICVP